MLWTAFIVLLVLSLMGLSIQLGWILIHFFLAVVFGGYRVASPVDIKTRVFTALPAVARL